MQRQVTSIENKQIMRKGELNHPLQSRADDVLIAIAILGLIATIADGDADYREIDSFTRDFKKRFALSRRQSVKLILNALKRIQFENGTLAIDGACETLNEHLNASQKIGLFEALSDVLLANGQIHEGEEYFLDYIIGKLHLLKTLEMRYPHTEAN